MKVIFDEDARDDLRRIFNWIARDNPASAERLVKRILDKIARLESPELVHMGRPGVVIGTRELLEGPTSLSIAWMRKRERSSSAR